MFSDPQVVGLCGLPPQQVSHPLVVDLQVTEIRNGPGFEHCLRVSVHIFYNLDKVWVEKRLQRSHLTSVRNDASSHRVASEMRLNSPSQILGISPSSPWYKEPNNQNGFHTIKRTSWKFLSKFVFSYWISHHGVRLPRASLSVGKNTGVITLERSLQHIYPQVSEHLWIKKQMKNKLSLSLSLTLSCNRRR